MSDERYTLHLMVERPNSSGSPPMWRPSSYPQVMFGCDVLTAQELAVVVAKIQGKAAPGTFESCYEIRRASA